MNDGNAGDGSDTEGPGGSGDNPGSGADNPNDDTDGDPNDGNAGGGNDGDNPGNGGDNPGNGVGNPNDGKDGDPNDGNAGGGNDGDNPGNSGDNPGNGGSNPNDDKDGDPNDGNAGGGNDGNNGNGGGSGNNGNGGGSGKNGNGGGSGNNGNGGGSGNNGGGSGNNGNGGGSGNNGKGNSGATSDGMPMEVSSPEPNDGLADSRRLHGNPTAHAVVTSAGGGTLLDASRLQPTPEQGAGFATGQPAHYVTDTAPERAVTLPKTGTLEYSLVGGTAPTDNRGNTGSLDSGHLTADFTNQTVTNKLSVTIGGDSWHATGNGSISSGQPVFNGGYDVTRGSGATGSGTFSGFFGGAALPSGAPSGAGIGYTLQSGDTTVDGAAAFSAQRK